MRVSKKFLNDFAYLANYYGWSLDEIEEMKQCTREDPEQMVRYWTTLAAAHRAGYEQNEENGYMRLGLWCAIQGWPAPFADNQAVQA